LKDSNASPKVETSEKRKVGVHFLVCNILGVKRHAEASGWGLGQVTNRSIIHNNLHKPNNKLVNAWLEHFWCMDEPWTYTNSQDSPWLGLRETTNFLFIVFSLPSHGAYTQMSFCPRILKLEVPKFSKLGFLQLWKPISFCANLLLKW
jgi:hypothetical protein